MICMNSCWKLDSTTLCQLHVACRICLKTNKEKSFRNSFRNSVVFLLFFYLQHMKRLYQILTSTQNVSFNLSKSTNDTVASLYHQTKRTDACYAAICDESSPNIFYQTKWYSYGIDALRLGWSVSSAHSCGSGTCACASIWYLAAWASCSLDGIRFVDYFHQFESIARIDW